MSTASARRTRVLLAVDGHAAANGLGTILEGLPGEVDLTCAPNRRAAIRHAHDPRFDLVLLGISGQGPPNGDVTRCLRAFGTTPVVVVVPEGGETYALEALEVGADDYIVEGRTSPARARRVLENALRRGRLERELGSTRQRLGALTEFGNVALRGAPHAGLADPVGVIVTETIEVDRVAVLEIDGERVHVHGGFGVTTGPLDDADAGALIGSLNGTRRGGAATRTGTELADLLAGHPLVRGGMESAAFVTVPLGRSTGVLVALSREARSFSPSELAFLQTIAAALGTAARRLSAEAALRERVKELTALSAVGPVLRRGADPGEVAGDVAALLVPALQFPDDAGVTVILDTARRAAGREGVTPTVVSQVVVDGEARGEISFGYATSRPFLPEEHQLASSIADALRVWLAGEDADRSRAASQVRLEQVLAQQPCTVWTTDRDLVLTSVIGCDRADVGFTDEEATGRPLADLIGGDEEPSPALEMHRRALDGIPATYEFRRDGRTWHAQVEPFVEDGRIVGAIGSAIDVTDRVAADEARRASEDRLRRIAEGAPDIIFRLGGDLSHVEYVNPAIERLLGYPAAEVMADRRLLGSIVHQGDVARIESYGAGRSYQLRLRHRGGDWRWFEVRLVEVTDRDGHIEALEGIGRDITAQKELEAQRDRELVIERRVSEELRRVDAMKTAFLQAVSHELRTPLTSVVGFAELLMRPEVVSTDRAPELIRRLHDNALRLQDLLGDLLDVDRLSRGVIEANRELTDLAALVARTVVAMGLGAGEVEVDAPPLIADVDAPKVERIVENLVTNALRHAPHGGPILVSVAAAGGALDGTASAIELTVEDRGPGVRPDLRQAIFQPFRQGDSPTAKVRGAGIGLAIVDAFAKLHDGRAWVEERDGGGARFRVRLSAHVEVGAPTSQLGDHSQL